MESPGNALCGLLILTFVGALALLDPAPSPLVVFRLSTLAVGGLGFLASGIGVTLGGLLHPPAVAGASLAAVGVALVSDASALLLTDGTLAGVVSGVAVGVAGVGAVLVGVERWTGLDPLAWVRRSVDRRRRKD